MTGILPRRGILFVEKNRIDELRQLQCQSGVGRFMARKCKKSDPCWLRFLKSEYFVP